MRTLRLQQKIESAFIIPDDLASFLQHVSRLILEEDERAVLPSDDLLQCECAYGGLMEDSGNYGFSYFPEEGIRVKWEVILDKQQIEKIGNRDQKELVLWKCKDPGCGCAFSDEKESCFYCDYEGEAS